MITSFSTSSYAIHTDAFKTSIYIANKFENIINTTILRFYRDHSTTTMDNADYWPMAREYSIWNATIASLQFWTEDLNPVTLGRATEHVYTTFFYSSASHTLHQQSNETLFGHFVIALNAAFNQQLSLADEGYESGSDTIDLPTPLQKTPQFTTFPAWNMLHSTQFPPHLTGHHKPHPDQCSDTYLLAQQTTILQTAPQCAPTAQMMKKNISRWYPWMMNTGLLKKHLKEHYVFMNTVYPMDYASTHVLTWTLTLFLTWTVWI